MAAEDVSSDSCYCGPCCSANVHPATILPGSSVWRAAPTAARQPPPANPCPPPAPDPLQPALPWARRALALGDVLELRHTAGEWLEATVEEVREEEAHTYTLVLSPLDDAFPLDDGDDDGGDLMVDIDDDDRESGRAARGGGAGTGDAGGVAGEAAQAGKAAGEGGEGDMVLVVRVLGEDTLEVMDSNFEFQGEGDDEEVEASGGTEAAAPWPSGTLCWR